MRSLYDLLGADHPFDPTHRFTTSVSKTSIVAIILSTACGGHVLFKAHDNVTQWLIPPLALALVRLLLSLYTFTTIFVIFAYNDAHHNSVLVRQFFSYFTNLGYFGLAFYFVFSGLHTLSYSRTGKPWLHRWPRPLQALHSLYYTAVVTYPILVTAVFWAVLYDGHWFPIVFNGWSNTSEHALNTVFAAFEIFLTRTMPPPLLHLLLLIIILVLYLALAYITHESEGFYPYSFLDPKKGSGKVAGYVFGILAAIIVIFGVVWAVIWLRRWITEKKLGMEGKFAGGRKAERREDVEMMAERPK